MSTAGNQVQVSGRATADSSARASMTQSGDWGYLSSAAGAGGWCDLWLDFNITEPCAFFLRAQTSWDGKADTGGQVDFARVEFMGFYPNQQYYQFGRLWNGLEYPASSGTARGVLQPGHYKIFGQCWAATTANAQAAPWYTSDAGSASYEMAFSVVPLGASAPPTLNTTVPNAAGTIGASITLSVDATDVATYQWYKNGQILPGATLSTLTLTDLKTEDAGSYTVELFNSAGLVTTDPAHLSVGAGGPTENHAPVANAGAGQTVECQQGVGTVLLDGRASTDPDGDSLTFQWSEGGVLLGSGPTLSWDFTTGTHQVTLTVTDPGGLSAESTVVIQVRDSLPPAITCPADITLPSSVDFLVPATFAATATDNCDPAPTITYSQEPGSGFPVGTTTVRCVAQDTAGNKSECSFNVTRAALGFDGFFSPLGGADASGGSFGQPLRSFKSGSTIPVKFTAHSGGVPVLTGIHRIEVARYTDATTGGLPIAAQAQDAATVGNQFRLVDGQWQFNLNTRATGMAPGVWRITVTLSDGSQHSAWVQLK